MAEPLGGDLEKRLTEWLRDARVDEDAQRRSRERWLRQQAEEGATFAGVLHDLAERGARVAVQLQSGREHHGVVRAVGADFCALRSGSGRDVLLALRGIAVVRTGPGVEGAAGDRAVTVSMRLDRVLADLAAEREHVVLVPIDGGTPLAGQLRAIGRDVVTVRLDGDPPATAYVAIAAIGEVALAG